MKAAAAREPSSREPSSECNIDIEEKRKIKTGSTDENSDIVFEENNDEDENRVEDHCVCKLAFPAHCFCKFLLDCVTSCPNHYLLGWGFDND